MISSSTDEELHDWLYWAEEKRQQLPQGDG
jgi:hypothetical protein